jgi:ATP-dependent helicase/DNAse subunit B
MAKTPRLWGRAPGHHSPGQLFRYCRRRAGRGGQFLYLVPNLALLRVRTAGHADGRGRLQTLQSLAQDVVQAVWPEQVQLDDHDRWVVVSRVVAELQAAGELAHSAAIAGEQGYIAGMAAAIHDLKAAGVGPEAVAGAVAPRRPVEAELGRIYAAYQKALTDRHLLDTADLLTQAATALRSGAALPMLDRVTVAGVEGFFGLSAPERGLLEALAQRLPEVWVDALEEPGEPLFEPIRRSVAGWAPGKRTQRERHEHSDGPLLALERCLLREAPASAVAHEDRVRLVTGPGLSGEVTAVAREVKRILTSEDWRGDQVALIVPDTLRYGPVLRQTFQDYGIPLQHTGEPVSAYPLGQTVLDLVQLAAGAWNEPLVVRLLRSPYLALPEIHPADVNWLEARAYNWAPTRVQADWEVRLAGESSGHAQSVRQNVVALAGLVSGLAFAQPVSAFAAAVEKILEQMEGQIVGLARQNPSEADSLARAARELGALGAIRRILHRLSRVHAIWGSAQATPQEFATLLAREMDQENHRVEPRTPGPGVQVLNPGQAYGRRFPIVFVVGLAESVFPRGHQPGFVLPEARRRDLGLETVEAHLARERVLFLTAVTRADQRLYLSYPAPGEGQEFLRSQFIRDVEDVFSEKLPLIALKASEVMPGGFDQVYSPREMGLLAARALQAGPGSPAAATPRQNPLDRAVAEALRDGGYLPDWTATEHRVDVDRLRESDGYSAWEGLIEAPAAVNLLAGRYAPDRPVSVGEAETHALCGFRHLGERVLRLRAWEVYRPGDGAKASGTLRHAILAGFRRRWTGRLAWPDRAPALAVLEAVVDEALQQEYPKGVPGYRRQKELRWASAWLDAELDLQETCGDTVRPRFFELGFGVTDCDGKDPASTDRPLRLTAGGQEALFSGVIDRVDAGDGPFVVYDYKQVSANRDWAASVKADLAFQPPLYAEAVRRLFLPEGQLAGAAYYITNKLGGKKLDRKAGLWRNDYAALGAVKEGLSPEELEARLAAVTAAAVGAVTAMRTGDYRVAHREPCPSYCPLRFGCRRYDTEAPFVKGETADAE